VRRAEVVAHLTDLAARGEPIVAGAAGSGLSARCQEDGGVDLLVVDHAARHRAAGHPSVAGVLATGDANDVTAHLAAEVLAVVRGTPVLAGVNGTDPALVTGRFLRGLAGLGVAGIVNSPTVGLVDGAFRAHLEDAGLGYGREVDLVAAAHAADLLTAPLVFSVDDAHVMVRAGADLVVCHPGLAARTPDERVALVDEWSAAAREVRDDVLVLCHGGPADGPAEAAFVLDRARACHGLYLTSALDRRPVEAAVTARARAFRAALRG
jgi:predicted TIM-barrel enzyme